MVTSGESPVIIRFEDFSDSWIVEQELPGRRRALVGVNRRMLEAVMKQEPKKDEFGLPRPYTKEEQDDLILAVAIPQRNYHLGLSK